MKKLDVGNELIQGMENAVAHAHDRKVSANDRISQNEPIRLIAMAKLNDEDFAHVIRLAPLIAIDLILRDPEGKIFVARRNNEPAKGFYFVPGGSIYKNERLDDAFMRILADETGLRAIRSEARFLGVYEHLYSTNCYGDPNFGSHYVVLGYELILKHRPDIHLDAQHSDYRWMSKTELLADAKIHENTKAYFRT
jgi:colanic acid biosynthesis protein WcaH